MHAWHAGALPARRASCSIPVHCSRPLLQAAPQRHALVVPCAFRRPQPNSRLLVNYGIVDENNPYDKLQMTVSVPNSDPLYQRKRSLLHTANLSSTQTFDLARTKPLPPMLLPYMRVAFASSQAQLDSVSADRQAAGVAGVACVRACGSASGLRAVDSAVCCGAVGCTGLHALCADAVMSRCECSWCCRRPRLPGTPGWSRRC